MNEPTEHRDELVGAAVESLPLEAETAIFFDRLTQALDREDAERHATPTPRKERHRTGFLVAATGAACLLAGGIAGAALAHREPASPIAAQGQSAARIAYTVVGNRQIAGFHAHRTGVNPAGGVGTSGLGLTVPATWDGRVLFPDTPNEMPVIQAGNFGLPADQSTDGSGAIQRQMTASDVFIWIGDYGQPPAWMLTSPLWQQTNLPITVSPKDAGTYDGQTVPLFLLRHVIVEHHALLVGVEFGTDDPSDQAYAQANQILSTLTLN
jgi:hypothetical protein